MQRVQGQGRGTWPAAVLLYLPRVPHKVDDRSPKRRAEINCVDVSTRLSANGVAGGAPERPVEGAARRDGQARVRRRPRAAGDAVRRLRPPIVAGEAAVRQRGLAVHRQQNLVGQREPRQQVRGARRERRGHVADGPRGVGRIRAEAVVRRDERRAQRCKREEAEARGAAAGAGGRHDSLRANRPGVCLWQSTGGPPSGRSGHSHLG